VAGRDVVPTVAQIDHILGKRVRFREARVLRGGGSDPFPEVVSARVPRWRAPRSLGESLREHAAAFGTSG
jgi:hypothetical protein